MKLRIRDFTRCPLTREDARIMAQVCSCPEQIDFSEVISISHCFADELFSRFSPSKPTVVNASPFVATVVSAVTAA